MNVEGVVQLAVWTPKPTWEAFDKSIHKSLRGHNDFTLEVRNHDGTTLATVADWTPQHVSHRPQITLHVKWVEGIGHVSEVKAIEPHLLIATHKMWGFMVGFEFSSYMWGIRRGPTQ